MPTKREDEWGNYDDSVGQALFIVGEKGKDLHPTDKARFYRKVEEFAKSRAIQQEDTNERIGVPE